MNKNTKILIASIFPGLGLVLVLWFIKFLEYAFGLSTSVPLAVQPRSIDGLIGILTAPLIHSDIGHLASNSIPLIVLLSGIVFFYYRLSKIVFLWIYFMSNVGVWLIGSPGYHLGASGLVYGFAAFLFFSGIFRKEPRSMAVALLVALLYGSMIWGVLPLQKNISWESHLMGAVMGTLLAFYYRKDFVLEAKKYSWQNQKQGNSDLTYTFDDEGIQMNVSYEFKESEERKTQKMYDINYNQYKK